MSPNRSVALTPGAQSRRCRLATVPLSGQLHLALGAVPLVLAYAAVRYRPVAAAWCAGGALAVVLLSVLIRYTVIAGSAEGGGRSLAEVGEYSAEWSDFLSRRVLGGMEEFVFLGWLTPVLALVGLVVLWRRSRALALLLGVVAVVPVVLAFGTTLPIYSPLWHSFPPLQFPRVPERLLPLADLALAALVAFAAAGLAARARGFAAAVSAALLVLVTADLAVQPFEAAAADRATPPIGRLRMLRRGACSSFPSSSRASTSGACTTTTPSRLRASG